MYTLTVFDGTTKYSIPFEGTKTVQQVLEAGGITMPHPCGGMGKCGKCAIEAIGNLSLPDEAELACGSRLSCRTKLYGNAIVTLKNPSFSKKTTLIAEGCSEDITPVSVPAATIIGAAVDIGTTTIAISIYDLITGHCLASKTMLNPQSVIAADVMGRIDAATKGKLSDLQNMLVSCIRTLAEDTGLTNGALPEIPPCSIYLPEETPRLLLLHLMKPTISLERHLRFLESLLICPTVYTLL